jgi:hypothetical protein
MSEIRRISSGFQQELTSALDAEERRTTESAMKPQSPGGPQDLTAGAEEGADDGAELDDDRPA